MRENCIIKVTLTFQSTKTSGLQSPWAKWGSTQSPANTQMAPVMWKVQSAGTVASSTSHRRPLPSPPLGRCSHKHFGQILKAFHPLPSFGKEQPNAKALFSQTFVNDPTVKLLTGCLPWHGHYNISLFLLNFRHINISSYIKTRTFICIEGFGEFDSLAVSDKKNHSFLL